MPERICSVDRCERLATSKGMCPTHRYRLRVYGDPRADVPIGSTNRDGLKPLAGRQLYKDREWMRVRFEDRMMSFAEIAAEAGCALRTVARWMHTHEIEVRPSWERREDRGNNLHGERSPVWKGGPPRCACGAVKSYYTQGCMACRDNSGEKNPRWVGDAGGYVQAHWRVKSQHGPARGHPCVVCGGRAAHWAYDHADPEEKTDPDEGPYSLKSEHYRPMCVRCHKRFDMDWRRRCSTTAPDLSGLSMATPFS